MSDEEVAAGRPALPVRTRVRAQQKDLGLAWLLAVVAGAAGIWLLPDDMVTVRSLMPLGVIIAYLLFALPRSPQGIPKIADSAYFMGFLWTLWALIVVLVSKADNLTAPELYRAFGHALIATGTGMAARLFLLQFYRSVGDQEDEAVDDIDDHVGAVRDRLATHSIAVAQDLESLEKLIRDLGVSVRAGSTKLAAASERVAGAADSGAESFVRAIADVTVKLNSQTVSPTLVSDKVSGAFDEVQLEMTAAVKDVATTIRTLGKGLEKVRVLIAGWESEFQSVSTASGQVTAALGVVSQGAGQLTSGMTAAGAALKGCSQEAEGFQQSVKGAAALLDGQIEQTKRQIAELQSSVATARDDARKVDSTIREVISFVQGTVRPR